MIGVLCRLIRLRLVLMNGVAALGGYLLYPAWPEAPRALLLVAGVILTASAGSALNQLLERDLDSLMERTRNRPLPRGDLSPAAAALLGGSFLLAGMAFLYCAGGGLPPAIGSCALLLYLPLYTPFKRRTPFALLLGALCGALAPVIGWSVAGGDPLDFRIVNLAGVIYLWQIPHFWLLQRRHADDYRRAALPLFTPAAKSGSPGPLFRLWMVALIAASLMLPAFGMVGRQLPLWCAVFAPPLVFACVRRFEAALFASLNLFPLLLTLALCVDR